MKIKYYRLSKEERKEYKNKFYATKKGKNLKKFTTGSYIASFALLFFGIYYIIDTYINKGNVFYYYYAALIIIISIIMIISNHKLRIEKINDYIVKK